MADPYVHRIVQRLDALEPPPEVIDPEHRPDRAPAPPALPPGAPGTLAVIGFELPPELDWPPPGLPAASGPAPRIAGGAREREQALLIAAQSGEGAPVPEAAARRWRDWLQAEDLPGVALLDSVAAADDWVASLDV